jgi:hypothetical protein
VQDAIEWNLFNAAPGDNGFLGERNNIFKGNKVNERVRFAEPLSLPRAADPENGVKPEMKELKASLTKEYINDVLHKAAKEVLQAHLYSQRKEPEPVEIIPGHVNQVPSSQDLPRQKNNELRPVIDLVQEFLPVDDQVMQFNKIGYKRSYDSWNEPLARSSKIARF